MGLAAFSNSRGRARCITVHPCGVLPSRFWLAADWFRCTRLYCLLFGLSLNNKTNKQKKQSKLKTVTFPVGRQVYGSLPSWPSKSLAVAEAAERCRGVTRRAAEEGLRCAAGGGAAFRSSALRSAHTRGEGAPIPSTWSVAPYIALNE